MDRVFNRPGDGITWLRHKFPLGSFWYVRTWDGTRNGITWCGRYGDDIYQADSPGHLAEQLAEADDRAKL